MTENHIHATTTRVGRKKQWTERIQLPMAEGTTATIDALLNDDEVRLDFIRAAIDKEIKTRKRKARLPGAAGDQDDIDQPD